MAGCLLASLAQWPGRDEMVGENLPRSKESPGPGAGAAGPGEAEETSSRSVIPAQLTSNNLVMVFQKPQRVGCALKTL